MHHDGDNNGMRLIADSYLPDECWQHILKLLNSDRDDDNNCSYLKAVSMVSKQLYSITNGLRFSLAVYNPTRPFLIRLFHRFSNLTSLDLSFYHGDLNVLLREISRFPFSLLTSLNISNQPTIPAKGLQALSNKITTLTSLICSNIEYIEHTDLFLIGCCFPLLEELDLADWKPGLQWSEFHCFFYGKELETLSFELSKLRKVNLSRHYYIDDQLLFHLFKNCIFLKEVILLELYPITSVGIASALRERPTLTSLSFSIHPSQAPISVTQCFNDSLVSLKGLTCLVLSYLVISDEFLSSIARNGLPLTRLSLQNCNGYSYTGIFSLLSKCQGIQYLDLQKSEFLNDQHVVQLSSYLDDLMSINLSHCLKLTDSALFALARKCHSLSEIKMESIGGKNVHNSDSLMEFGVQPQLKSLYLANNSWLNDESIIMFASIFPNLQLLDLRSCQNISKGVGQVLKSCCKIRNLNLAYCSTLNLVGMNFRVPQLEVLNLSYTKVDDGTLYVTSKNCRGLLHLLLENSDVTEKGVKHVF